MKKSRLFIILIMSSQFFYIFAQENKVKDRKTIYASKLLNDNKCLVEILKKDKTKFWRVTNLDCSLLVVGKKSKTRIEPYMDGPQKWEVLGIGEGDTLRRGKSKIYPIDFFSGDSHYNKKYPNFLLRWSTDTVHQMANYFAHFQEDSIAIIEGGRIVDFH